MTHVCQQSTFIYGLTLRFNLSVSVARYTFFYILCIITYIVKFHKFTYLTTGHVYNMLVITLLCCRPCNVRAKNHHYVDMSMTHLYDNNIVGVLTLRDCHIRSHITFFVRNVQHNILKLYLDINTPLNDYLLHVHDTCGLYTCGIFLVLLRCVHIVYIISTTVYRLYIIYDDIIHHSIRRTVSL